MSRLVRVENGIYEIHDNDGEPFWLTVDSLDTRLSLGEGKLLADGRKKGLRSDDTASDAAVQRYQEVIENGRRQLEPLLDPDFQGRKDRFLKQIEQFLTKLLSLDDVGQAGMRVKAEHGLTWADVQLLIKTRKTDAGDKQAMTEEQIGQLSRITSAVLVMDATSREQLGKKAQESVLTWVDLEPLIDGAEDCPKGVDRLRRIKDVLASVLGPGVPGRDALLAKAAADKLSWDEAVTAVMRQNLSGVKHIFVLGRESRGVYTPQPTTQVINGALWVEAADRAGAASVPVYVLVPKVPTAIEIMWLYFNTTEVGLGVSQADRKAALVRILAKDEVFVRAAKGIGELRDRRAAFAFAAKYAPLTGLPIAEVQALAGFHFYTRRTPEQVAADNADIASGKSIRQVAKKSGKSRNATRRRFRAAQNRAGGGTAGGAPIPITSKNGDNIVASRTGDLDVVTLVFDVSTLKAVFSYTGQGMTGIRGRSILLACR